MAVVIATAFFAHETIVDEYSGINKANADYSVLYNQSKEARDLLIESTKGTPLYIDYIAKFEAANESYKTVTSEYAKIKFLEFSSFQQFMGEFGWAFGLFMFSLFALIITFHNKSETLIGRAVFFSTPLFISIFFLRWCFKHEDFSKPSYIIANLVTAFALIYSAYIYVNWKGKYVEKLKEKIAYLENSLKKAFSFIYEETDDKEWIRKEKIKEHAIRRLEVTEEIVLGYEEIR